MEKLNFKRLAISMALTNIVVFGLGFASIYLLDQYGWSVFVILPVLLGFIPVYIQSKKEAIGLKTTIAISIANVFLACVLMLIFAVEGFICLAMASPLLMLMSVLGGLAGKYFNEKAAAKKGLAAIVIPIIVILSFGFDLQNKPLELIPVRTAIYVNAPIETVWQNVVAFDTINPPTDWVFKTGIAYPENATIKGKGVGAIRYCNFTTGRFVEPITAWNEPHLLQFDVTEQPVPMEEFNPFYDIHPPHLSGYFASQKGEFSLTEMPDGTTKLAGTTWYKLKIFPVAYWGKWSDFIIHRIHLRVLNHIKIESENTPLNSLSRGEIARRKHEGEPPLLRGAGGV